MMKNLSCFKYELAKLAALANACRYLRGFHESQNLVNADERLVVAL